jgi:hypothetical protein
MNLLEKEVVPRLNKEPSVGKSTYEQVKKFLEKMKEKQYELVPPIGMADIFDAD